MSKYIKKNLPPKTHCINGHEFTPENTGYRSSYRYCRECQKLRTIKYNEKHPDRQAARVARTKNNARAIKSNLVEYKGRKCADCNGVFHPCVYHFDHRDPRNKNKGVAQIMHRPLEEIKKEVDKCDLVCANCHAIRTYGNADVSKKISASRIGKRRANVTAISIPRMG